MINNDCILIGFSGHALVVYDILKSRNIEITGYCEKESKSRKSNFNLQYLGKEEDNIDLLKKKSYFVSVGDNSLRKSISSYIISKISNKPINAVHCNSFVSPHSELGNGVMVGSYTSINSNVKVCDGVVCNTGSIIEHECIIEEYSHIAPGAVLCGNVTVGSNTFIGARSVIKQGVTIGDNVTIGAGTVVISNVSSNLTVVGNPGRLIKSESK